MSNYRGRSGRPFRRRRPRQDGPAKTSTATQPRPNESGPPRRPFVAQDVPALEGAFTQLLPRLRLAIGEEGYETPTPIQAQAIPPLLEGRDVFGTAQTGTGKTAAFTLPLLQYLTENQGGGRPGRPRALILAPTRELAAQIGDSISAYGRHLHISHTVIFGGVGQVPQVRALQRGAVIVVATPGRLLDLMQQGHIHLDAVEVFVLDEVDRMLDMGFIHDVRRIIATLPKKRQSLFFSATLPPDAMELARMLVKDPVHVAIEPEQPTVEKIAQKVLFVEKRDKDALLATLLRDETVQRVLVFTRMKHAANKVVKKLSNAGVPGAAIHGNKSQRARTQALARFKEGRVRVLVATDIAARGIDVDGITHVINYDLPNEPETYVHRIGRTARAGAEGDAISFCSTEERAYLRDIERLLRKRVPADVEHAYHSDAALNAIGSSSGASSKARRGGGGARPAGHRGKPRSHAGPSTPRSWPRRGTRSRGR